MEIKASAKYLRISPRKLRALTVGLRGLSPQKALLKLQSYPQKGSIFLRKVVLQAMANAKNNFKLNPEKTLINSVEVGEGPAFKRIDRSHGARFDRGIIRKKTAHIFLTLKTQEENLPKLVENTKKIEETKKPETKKPEGEKKIEEKPERRRVSRAAAKRNGKES